MATTSLNYSNFAPGLQFTFSPNKSVYPAYQQDGVTFYHYSSFGLSTNQVLAGAMEAALGRDVVVAGQSIRQLLARQTPVNAAVGWINVGQDVIPNPQVVSIQTPAGTALPSITVRVTLEGGLGGQFFGTNTPIRDVNGREFLVLSESAAPGNAGQDLVLLPADGLGNLVVTGSAGNYASVNFPIGALLGRGAQSKAGDNCVQTYYNWYPGNKTRIRYKMNRKSSLTTYSRQQFQNEIQSQLRNAFILGDASENSSMKNIGLYITRNEMISAYIFQAQCLMDNLYQEDNLNPQLNAMHGPGLKNQIPPDLRIQYSESYLGDLGFIQEMVKDFQIDNPGVEVVTMLFGTNAYTLFQTALGKTQNPIRWASPEGPTVYENAFVYAYKRFQDLFGFTANLIHMPELRNRFVTGQRTGTNPNEGAFSNHIWMLDMDSDLMNFDPAVVGYVPEGGLKKISYHCLLNPSGTPDDYVDVWRVGRLDTNGDVIKSGAVVSLDETIQRYRECTSCFALNDQRAARFFYV